MLLEKVKKKIHKYRKVKYQKIIFSKRDISLREDAIQLINNTGIRSRSSEKFCTSCLFYKRHLNETNFIIFYKKFNANLQLKDKYFLNSYKKSSNKNACFNSYILFSSLLKKNRKINNIQKLNTILKINDLLILIYKKNKHSHAVGKFMKNIDYEKKLIKKYL